MNDLTKLTETAATQCLQVCRGQFEGALGLANALLSGAERMRAVQLAAAQEMQEKNAQIAGQAAGITNLQDLMTLQARLMTDYCSSALLYWTKLAVVARDSQAELAALAQKQGSEAIQQASASTTASSGSPGFASAAAPESFVKVMQTAFDAARGANEAFVKAFAGAATLPATEAKKPAKAAPRSS